MSSKKSKKKHSKKQFRPASAPTATRPVAPASLPQAIIATPTLQPAPVMAEVPGLKHIRHDIRRVLVLAGSFVAIELILWYLFGHTGVGPAVYRLIKL